MRKFLLVVSLVTISLMTRAQVSPADEALARQICGQNLTSIGISRQDLDNSLVSSTYQASSGIRMVYLQQSYKGIPVYNQMQILAFRDGKLVSAAGSRIRSIDKLVNVPSAAPSVDVEAAVVAALKHKGLDASGITKAKDLVVGVVDDGIFNFGKLGVTTEDVTAQLIWVPVEKEGVKLAWQVRVVPIHSDDYLLMRMDATNSMFLGQDNLTVYDSWNKEQQKTENKTIRVNEKNYVTIQTAEEKNKWQYRPWVVNGASYLVVKYPAESPIHPGGTPTLHTDPWTMAGGNAVSLKWHSDGTTDYNITRGNNVWATEDRAAANANTGLPATSSTSPDPLTFNFPPDFNAAPTTAAFQQFAITNLFYWNNLMHDLNYNYGFDEVSGNFQTNNQGRGGAGNDDVSALAQSGAGTNNANFLTPADGGRGRMRMYLFTAPNPDRDGDLDNGVITHEYGHGISTRLTGGPANSSCLNNAEEGGEGWSDYFALMMTTNWATAQVTDGALARPMGTYVLAQPVTGGGIRNYPYSTNMAINPLTYANMGTGVIGTEVHNIGEIWCMALWEMTWEIINQTGQINGNLFNAAGTGGNSVALKLVIEGMRLQPCSPGFIDARNAILKADTLFYGAQYSCAIWRAFAKRGMGRTASQGSSNSATDQVASFIVDNGGLVLNENVQSQAEGGNVIYTNKVTSGICSPMTNFYVTDTLPTNVTYVSGGSYNAGNRTITFGPINLSNGASALYPFTVTVNNSTYFAPVTPLNETVAGTSIPATWTANPTTGNAWGVSTTVSHSAPNSFFAPDPSTVVSDQTLTSIAYNIAPATVSNYTTLSFWHSYNSEDGWDGGVVEISTNGGATWSDLGAYMFTGKYNSSLGTGSALANRAAFTGNSGGFINTVINLSSFAGQSVQIRFRFASDNNTAPSGGGWWVDDIVLYSEPAVQIKSSMFNATNVFQASADTLTRISQTVVCVPASITGQPGSVNVCSGSNTSFTVTATGTAPLTYQWQLSTGSGFSNIPAGAPYSGTNSATLNITGVTVGMNGYIYRCIVGNSCPSSVTSGNATLTVGATATLNSSPSNSTICVGANTSFAVSATNATSYQWQVNTGSGFTDIPAGAPYTGTTTATLSITAATAAMNNYQYRCVLGSCPSNINSNAATLIVNQPATISTQPVDVSVCQGSNANFSITAAGTIVGYQWQVSADAGATYTNIAGATTNSYALTAVTASLNNTRYRCVVTGTCGSVTSGAGILHVNAPTDFTFANLPAIICASDPSFSPQASLNGGVWTGNGISGGVFNPRSTGVGTISLTYTYTNSFGCVSAKTGIVQVNVCAERHRQLPDFQAVFIYPVPNDGHFSIRMNTDLYTKLGIKVYASDGKLVQSQVVTNIGFGSVIPVDISRFPSGAYRLYLYNDEGKFVSRAGSVLTLRK